MQIESVLPCGRQGLAKKHQIRRDEGIIPAFGFYQVYIRQKTDDPAGACHGVKRIPTEEPEQRRQKQYGQQVQKNQQLFLPESAQERGKAPRLKKKGGGGKKKRAQKQHGGDSPDGKLLFSSHGHPSFFAIIPLRSMFFN